MRTYLNDSLGKPVPGKGHRKGSRSRSILSLDNLITAKLNSCEIVS